MRLSEAIRIGSKLRPQAYGTLSDGIGTCALGAAYEAVGALDATGALVRDSHLKTEQITGRYILHESPCRCPLAFRWMVFDLVPHLNDVHKWTREAIAEWVETVENAEEQKMEKASEVSSEKNDSGSSEELMTKETTALCGSP